MYYRLNKVLFKFAGHDKLSIHGLGKSWTKTDSERLVHKLILEGYLAEICVPSRDGIVNTYIKSGPKIELLLNNKVKVLIYNYFLWLY